MSNNLLNYENELIQKSIVEIRTLKKKLADLQAGQSEEIAIVGMTCTLPGDVSSPEEYWQFIINKSDGIREPVKSRWAHTNIANINYADDRFNGGFVSYDPFQFDPLFFGIPPKEANYMDPQQRLFLEDTWQALIDAGIDPKTMSGTNAGVFCGITNSEYFQMMLSELPQEALSGYITSGNCLNFAAGRISYILGLNGPSLAVDTACSSSLTAIHLAVQSLKKHECNMAIAGGVNLLLNPQTFLLLESGNMLSPDGRCKTFSENANGYARGEGCGVVILKRRRDAIADGDRIYATIKNTVVKHDGKKSGLTVPISSAQKMLLQEALSSVDIEAKNISYSEAHGTGTFLGDPVELEALNAVYGEGRSKEKPLHIGSVKSNFGHLEAAAGVAGLIKAALAIYHKKIPAHFPVDQLNSNFDWENSQLKVVTDNSDWPEDSEKIATVSSFGASGTNAHAILGESKAAVSDQFIARSQMLDLPKFKKQTCWYKPLSKHVKEEKSLSAEESSKLNHWTVETELNYDAYPLIADHLTFDHALLPMIGYINLAAQAINKINPHYQLTKLENLEITQPLMLHSGNQYQLRTTVDTLSANDYSYHIYAYSAKENIINKEWSLSCHGDLTNLSQVPKEPSFFKREILATFTDQYTTQEFYKIFWGDDFILGNSYHFLDNVWRKQYEVVGVIKNFANAKAKTGISDLSVGFLQIYMSLPLAMAAVPDEYLEKVKQAGATCIAKSLKRFVIYAENGLAQYEELWAHAVLADKETLDNKWITDFKFYNEKGVLVAEVEGAEFHIIKKEALDILKASTQQIEVNPLDDSIEVKNFLENEITEIVGIEIEQLAEDMHLGELMDSIMALQLRAKIEKKLAILLPLDTISKTKSVDDLAHEIVSRSNGLLK